MPIASKDYLKHSKFSNTVAAADAWTPVTVGGQPVSLKSRVIQQGYYEYWLPNNSSCEDTSDGQILNQL